MTDLEVYRQPGGEVAVAHDIDSWTLVAAKVIKLAEEIYDTPFVPDGLRGSVPATAAAILAGRELGLGPMTSLANIHVIKGKPALSAALMRALILAQGHQIETVGQITDTRVVVRGRRRGEAAWEEASFTADQARQAKIDISGYPQDKLYARATSRLARRKFADVIAGMPYSAEELEDGPGDVMLAGESHEGLAGKAAPNQPAQRTARRGRAPQNVPPVDAATPPPPAGTAAPPQSGTAGGAQLPPLPGEEEVFPTQTASGAGGPGPSTSPPADTHQAPAEPDDTDYDTPGTVSAPQITAIWTILTNVFKFTKDEKDQARAVCAHIIGHELASTKDMTHNEARTALDTLSTWRELAEKNNMTPRDLLVELMVKAANAAEGSDG